MHAPGAITNFSNILKAAILLETDAAWPARTPGAHVHVFFAMVHGEPMGGGRLAGHPVQKVGRLSPAPPASSLFRSDAALVMSRRARQPPLFGKRGERKGRKEEREGEGGEAGSAGLVGRWGGRGGGG